MKTCAFFLSLILTQTCVAQLKLTKLDKNSIPKSIQYTGNIVQAVRWTDNTGDNIVVLTKTGKAKSKNVPDEDNIDQSLFAYRFVIASDSIKQTWRVYDYVRDCPVDIFLNFVDNAFAITDLNKDGKAEIWIMYKVSCQGDVSPVTMKIIMYQDDEKFAFRGKTRVKLSANEYVGGEYTFDEAFKNSPTEFRQYAEKLWDHHKTETWKQ